MYINRDASNVIARRKNNQIGEVSSNLYGGLISFTDYRVINTINDALCRIRHR
jgi:hypothetical protein